MPKFLTDSERERLKSFPDDLDFSDAIRYFTLTLADLALVRRRSGDYNRLGFAVQLGALRCLGFIPDDLNGIPAVVLEFVARQLDIAPDAGLGAYGTRSQTRTDNLREIERHLGFRKPEPGDLAELGEWLAKRAEEHDKPTYLYLLAAERLYRQKIVWPAVTAIERLVIAARQAAQAETFRKLEPALSKPIAEFLDRILEPDQEIGGVPLAWLRFGATANTPSDILKTIRKLEYLRDRGVDKLDLSAINPNRLRFLAQLGRRSSNQALQRSHTERRYPILAAFVKQTLQEITDELVELFDRCLGDCYTRAKGDLDKFHLAVAKAKDEKLRLFSEVMELILNPEISPAELRGQIFNSVVTEEDLRAAVGESRRIIRPQNDHSYDFLANRYVYIREFSPKFLKALTFRSNREHSLLKAVEIIRTMNMTGKTRVPDDAPVDFIHKSWLPHLRGPKGTLVRKYYEISTLWHLRQALRSGDVWVENSRRYADPESYLIPREQWPSMREEACKILDLPLDGAERIRDRRVELEAFLVELDGKVEREEGVRMEDGKLIVGRLKAEEPPQSAVRLQKLVTDRLPHVDLHHLVVEVDNWTGYTKHFEHAGGKQPRSPHLRLHLYASVLAQANNHGPDKMAEIAGLSAAQLIWCTNWYLRGETLQPAINGLVNYQFHLPLARQWGSGAMSSSDGQRFPMGVKSRNSAVIPRYGYGRILTLCSWTSDINAQWRCKPEPSMVRDATYVLDGMLDNETELPLFEHTTDTAGYTELIFALFDLLGLQFSPRIKDLGDQSIYCADKGARYRNIGKILAGAIKDGQVLEEWDSFLRLAASLKLGYVTASLFVSKLQSQSRQSRLMKALQEYGRLIKSIYIPKYICREDQQRRVSRQLNKGEGLHSLRQWLLYADEGKINKSQLQDQTTQADALTLVTNAVIVWNTVYMQAVIEQLKAEGLEVSDEDVRYLSPCRFEHINKYGRINFNIEEELERKGLRPLRKANKLLV